MFVYYREMSINCSYAPTIFQENVQQSNGGMGMSMLQKMGWKPGEGLGRNNEGAIEPLNITYKKNKRGE